MTKESIETLSALALIAMPVLLLLLGGLGWLLKRAFEKSHTKQIDQLQRIRDLEDKLREDRITTYNALLEPFFILFTSDAAFLQDQKYKGKNKNDLAVATMLSVEYRRVGFKLSLIATDEVVRCYNRLMQFFYHTDDKAESLEIKTAIWIKLLGDLLLEIRKSMGNAATHLDRWEMVEWFMKDAATLKKLSEQ